MFRGESVQSSGLPVKPAEVESTGSISSSRHASRRRSIVSARSSGQKAPVSWPRAPMGICGAFNQPAQRVHRFWNVSWAHLLVERAQLTWPMADDVARG
eukprot:7132939-Prymnesium_polylepis.1